MEEKKKSTIRIWFIELESVTLSVEVLGLGWVLEFKGVYKDEKYKHLDHCFKVRLAEQFKIEDHFDVQTELELKKKDVASEPIEGEQTSKSAMRWAEGDD